MSATLNWLGSQCQQFFLHEKWLLCHKTSVGQIWKDRINLSGVATINLHCKTIGSVATSIAADTLCQQRITFLDRARSTAVLQEMLANAIAEKRLTYFHSSEHVVSLAKVLERTFQDLRLAFVTPDQLTENSIQPHSKAADLKLLYSTYCDALQNNRYADLATCIELATDRIRSGEYAFTKDLIVLIPEELELSAREKAFLGFLAQRTQVVSRPGTPTFEQIRRSISQRAIKQPNTFHYRVAHGEINEIRVGAQRILRNASGQTSKLDDIEIVYSDSSYAPLIYEFFCTTIERLRSEGLVEGNELTCPVTFAEGLSCVYARPGRALRGWLRWRRADFVQAKAVQMVREGLLERPKSADEIGYARLASNLRAISIGFDRGRYLPQIQAAIEHAVALQTKFQQTQPQHSGDREVDNQRDFGLPALRALEAMFQSLLRVTPTVQDSASNILAKSKRFLLQSARCESQLDREARTKLLDSIDAKAQSLELASESSSSILSWLEELPVNSRIIVSGPQPGCIYASRIADAGYSGRKLVFVMGLEASRFPKFAAVDPVLLDGERRQVSTDLTTTVEKARVEQQSLYALLFRVLETADAEIHFSYSNRDLIEDRGLSPSPALVDLFRLTQGNPMAHVEDLVNFAGPAISFVGVDEATWLDSHEGRLAGLLTIADPGLRQEALEQQHVHFAAARLADSQRIKQEFTAFDGYVPKAGEALDPTISSSRCSPSRLEAFGACPRRFFFRYGLRITPPDEWSVDPEQWLDPLLFGSLIHHVFEEFMRELTRGDLIPNLTRDKARLLELLHASIDVYQQHYPCRSPDAKNRQLEQLEQMCHIFLREEQRYCEASGARPWILEASFGLDDTARSPLDSSEPIEVTLNDGRSIQVVGRIDRIDRLDSDGGASYTIWDYKSGSDFGFNQGDPFNQGRRLQSFLYVSMLRHRIVDQGDSKPKTFSFGYFFPSPKLEGKRIQWSSSELKQGDAILQTICDMIAGGVFPATTNKADCSYCDYASVCGNSSFVAFESLRMAKDPCNRDQLADWLELRKIQSTEAAS
jgi:RecB family exonuclease